MLTFHKLRQIEISPYSCLRYLTVRHGGLAVKVGDDSVRVKRRRERLLRALRSGPPPNFEVNGIVYPFEPVVRRTEAIEIFRSIMTSLAPISIGPYPHLAIAAKAAFLLLVVPGETWIEHVLR
jgi:hypothetical protein